MRKVIFFMGQAIIVRASGGYNSNGGGNNSGQEEIVGWQEKYVIINTSQLWTVPLAKNNEFSVRIFGGGAGMSAWYNEYLNGKIDQINVNGTVGGGSGYMNNTIVTLNEYDQVQVSIGAGGGTNTAGGTTAFGTYLSATGGKGPNGGACGGSFTYCSLSSGTNNTYGGRYGDDGTAYNGWPATGGGSDSITCGVYSISCYGGGGGYGAIGGSPSIRKTSWGGAGDCEAHGGYGGGYGPENYGRGGSYGNNIGKSGICLITYQAPIYKT